MRSLTADVAASIRSLIVRRDLRRDRSTSTWFNSAHDAGVDVTSIGDPVAGALPISGACPELVPGDGRTQPDAHPPLIAVLPMALSTARLNSARQPRAGEPTTLPPQAPDAGPRRLFLATEWKHLWDLDAGSCRLRSAPRRATSRKPGNASARLRDPLAAGSRRGIRRRRLRDTPYRRSARRRPPRCRWPDVIAQLLKPGDEGPKEAYVALVGSPATENTTPRSGQCGQLHQAHRLAPRTSSGGRRPDPRA